MASGVIKAESVEEELQNQTKSTVPVFKKRLKGAQTLALLAAKEAEKEIFPESEPDPEPEPMLEV